MVLPIWKRDPVLPRSNVQLRDETKIRVMVLGANSSDSLVPRLRTTNGW